MVDTPSSQRLDYRHHNKWTQQNTTYCEPFLIANSTRIYAVREVSSVSTPLFFLWRLIILKFGIKLFLKEKSVPNRSKL